LKLKALIFDVDGTLADTEEAHRCAFNDAFRHHGLDWNWSRPRYAQLLLTTGGKERLRAFIDSLPLTRAQRARLTDRIPEIHSTKTGLYTRMIAQGRVPLRDGVARLMDEAGAAAIQLAIASTTTLSNIEALLTTNLGPGALERFTVVGAGDQVRHKKPAPDIYELVLHELNRAAEDCVAVEDSRNGLQAAQLAGLFTIVTPSFWSETEDFAGADLVLPSLTLGIREIDRHLNARKARD
jgi:HAD superfamily hydrolase (TIGR01509 family)